MSSIKTFSDGNKVEKYIISLGDTPSIKAEGEKDIFS
jgi:hypothetical protein